MKGLGVSLVALLLLFAAGCKGSNEAAVIGKWKGQFKSGGSDQKDDLKAKIAEALTNMLVIDVEFKADHTFSMRALILPIEGTWSMSGSRILLQPKTVMGVAPDQYQKDKQNQGSNGLQVTGNFDKTSELELQPDGKTMKAVSDKPSTDGTEMVFTKQ